MKKAMWLAASVLAVTGVVGLAGMKEGDIEVSGLSKGGLNTSLAKGGGSSIGVTAVAGYVLKSDVELRGVFALDKTSGQKLSGAIMGGADYLFAPSDPWYPYAGGDIGVLFVGGTGKFGGDIHGGAKYFLADNVSLDLEASFKFLFDSIGDGDLGINAGLSVFFNL
jgi:hypothetical protein